MTARKTRTLMIGLAGAAWLWAPMALAQADATIRIVLPEQVSNLEPCNSSNSHVGRVVNRNITEGLTWMQPADSSVQPSLATAWDQVAPNRWRFTLREGVTFHDGAPFNAEAAAHAINRFQNRDVTCSTRSKLNNLVIRASAVDDHMLEVETDAPNPILPTLMSMVMIVSPNTPFGANTNDAVGTGPYVLDEFNTERVVLSRFDGYWGPPPAIAGATYVWRSESALRAAMVTTGEADLAPVIAVQDATDPKTDKAYLNSETTRFRIDLAMPPLDDIRVRKALNLAIEWDGLGTLFGPDALRASQMVVPGIVGHNADLTPWTYDPDQARALLAEARADGVPVDTELNIIVRSGNYPNSQEATEAMMAMWNEVGFKTRITVLDAAGWVEYLNKPYPENRGSSLLMQQHDNSIGDAVFTAPLSYHSDGQYSTVADPALDDLIERAVAASGDERADLFEEVFRYAQQEVVADVIQFHMVGYTRVGPRLDWTPSIVTNSQIALSEIGLND